MSHKKIIISILLCFFLASYIHAETTIQHPKKISIELQDISIHDALHFLAKIMNINLVINPEIHGTTSLHLKNVSPLEVFNLLLLMHELSIRRMNDVWYIMPRHELIQVEQQESRLRGVIDEAEPLRTAIWQIRYAKASDIANLLQKGNGTLLSKRGHVYVDTRTNIICVQDIPDHLCDIHKLIKRLDIPVKQVLIEVYLASMDHDYERALGINFVDQQANVNNVDHATEQTYLSTAMHYGLAIIKLTDGSWLRMQLSAMEKAGHGELISSPRLFTANQQSASIESGEEIPYQEISRSGATGVAFKKAVLSLRVTPQVMPGNQVLLQLQVNQDKPSDRVILGVPAIITRQISTNILIKHGQTIVLGGIYESDKGYEQQGIPYLNKIPLVGWLFKQQNVTDNKRELLIFVTPKVMN